MLSEDQKPQNNILMILLRSLREGSFFFFGPMAGLPNQPPVRDSSSHAPCAEITDEDVEEAFEVLLKCPRGKFKIISIS